MFLAAKAAHPPLVASLKPSGIYWAPTIYEDCPFGICHSVLVFNLQLKSPRGSEQMGLVIGYHPTREHLHSIWHIIPGTVTGKEIALGTNINKGRVMGFSSNYMWQVALLVSPSAAAHLYYTRLRASFSGLSFHTFTPNSSSSLTNSSANVGSINLSTSALSSVEKGGENAWVPPSPAWITRSSPLGLSLSSCQKHLDEAKFPSPHTLTGQTYDMWTSYWWTFLENNKNHLNEWVHLISFKDGRNSLLMNCIPVSASKLKVKNYSTIVIKEIWYKIEKPGNGTRYTMSNKYCRSYLAKGKWHWSRTVNG